MRSKNRTIEVTKALNFGHMPVFISFMHRHLEKEKPLTSPQSDPQTFNVPVDLLGLSVDDKSLLQGIESVELTYKRQ